MHAAWLADDGHEVHLVDPVPSHIEQAATDPRLLAEVADAQRLPAGARTVDVVLLPGPLYHLIDRQQRLAALQEARRVLQPRGWLFAAAISRFSALLDLLIRADAIHQPGVFEVVEQAVATGVFRGAEAGLFTTAYFHRPQELATEVSEAGFEDVELLNIEGPGFLAADFEDRWQDPDRRAALLRTARLIETDPDMLPAASHVMAIARAPG